MTELLHEDHTRDGTAHCFTIAERELRGKEVANSEGNKDRERGERDGGHVWHCGVMVHVAHDVAGDMHHVDCPINVFR